jgi:FAD:protein FMN transferase
MTGQRSSVSFPALGSVAVLVVSDASALDEARASVERTIEEFDLACSRFRDDSELSAVNAAAGAEVQVGPLLLDAVGAALRAARLTDGDVDPTVGQALIALGYDRDFDALGDGVGRTVSITEVPGWRTVRLDPERSTVRVDRGVRLDLGATAKALAADLAAERAADAAGCGVLVGLGGDFATAGPAPEDGWPIRVTDDHRAGVSAHGQWIAVHDGGLATSSTTVRRWRAGAGVAHHLVDPASGRSAEGMWRTVSVTAASCLDANIASTAAIVRGERALPWLEELGLPSRLVANNGIVRHVAGWPAAGDDLPSAHQAVPA